MSSRDDHRQRPNPPASEPHAGRGELPFTLLSVIVSLLLIGWGAGLALAGDLFSWRAVFGYASVVYGGLVIVILGWAYRIPGRKCISAIQAIAVGYLIAYVMALIAGLQTGFGVGGILVVAFAIWCHWFTVYKIVRKHAAS